MFCSTLRLPSSLVAKIRGRSLLFEPGSKFLYEEHSAYNLLALIVGKKTGVPFAVAADRLVFRPMGLTASGMDDDPKATPHAWLRVMSPKGRTD
jgi:CubicO group peptidase (beta-lactamase class C family)